MTLHKQPTDPVLLDMRPDGICGITLNRPRAANAIDTALADSLLRALSSTASDEAVRAVVITGAGDRVFCAGADIRKPSDVPKEEAVQERRANLRALIDAVLNFSKPCVVALNGTAAGGGAMLALLADAAVATADSSFLVPEIDLGMPSILGIAVLSEAGGARWAYEVVQSGRRVPAAEALARGLISGIASPCDLAERAATLAATLAGKPAAAFDVNKRWHNTRIRIALAAAMEAADTARRHEASEGST